MQNDSKVCLFRRVFRGLSMSMNPYEKREKHTQLINIEKSNKLKVLSVQRINVFTTRAKSNLYFQS